MSVTAISDAPASPLEQSRQYCASLTRRQAKNFYYGLKLLPPAKRQAMFALYAYMRHVDDIADGDEGQSMAHRREALAAWAEATQSALAGRTPAGAPIWPAFAEMVQRHNVPHRVFYDVIAGQRQDLDSPIIQTFDDLRQYCYRVAGVVGIASIYIWGFAGGEATEALAIDRGIAFQLTNILRDLREDAARGRIYLPRAELDAAGMDGSLTRGDPPMESFCKLMQNQIARAESFYKQSAGLESLISSDSRPTLTAMTQIYHGLLKKMREDPARVLRQRVTLSPMTKIRIAWRATRSR